LFQSYSIDDIINNKDDLDFVEAENDEDLAQELIEQMGGLEVISEETLQRYFNFGAYGRDLAIGDYSKISHGYIRDI
jgi:antirestriction protein